MRNASERAVRCGAVRKGTDGWRGKSFGKNHTLGASVGDEDVVIETSAVGELS